MARSLCRSTAALATLVASIVLPAAAEEFQGRKSVVEFWRSKGVASHVAEGIADNVNRESGFDPTRPGDGGTSLGLYQHHDERLRTLLANTENEQAFREVMGADPIAAAHWEEIKNASSRLEAARLWARYFERCAACGAATARRNEAATTKEKPAERPKNAAELFYDRLSASSDVYHASPISLLGERDIHE